MAGRLRFDGKVAIVTGGGNGLGRQYALAFAERGAKVVVNDLGGDFKGQGSSSRAADLVVKEIREKGGTAVPNYDSVENGDKVVQTALDNFGRVDILVNNAGILRDRSFARISDQDWDLVQRVHLRGSFLVSRAAWPHMKNQKYGRIINISSTSGIYGNFGQANYAAAKMGLVGLAKTLAIEGAKYNIKANAVAPTAGSRMTETVMPQDVVEALKPEYVAPLVLFLCHDSCPVTGEVFECGGGWMAKGEWHRSLGATVKRKGVPMTPEAVRDNWDKICDFTEYTVPKTSGEATTQVHGAAMQDESPQKVTTSNTSGIDPNVAIGQRIADAKFTYTDRDVILYALGVGLSTQHPDHLKFLFELSEDFSTLPSFGVIPATAFMHSAIGDGIKGLDIDPTKILHGEQYLELYQPLPTNGTLTSRATVADVLDKGSGALIYYNVDTFNEKGEKVMFSQFGEFVQKAGGFGGKKTSSVAKPLGTAPKRPPDATIKEKTSVDQAALYRLSGDRNPLHIDPSFAAMGGFSTPILHGLATFGYAVRHVLKQYCNNDVSKFKAVKVRFTRPVLPGETLQTDMWKEGSRIHFITKVVENGNVCLTGSYVDLNDGGASQTQTAATSQTLESDTLFELIAARVSSNPGLVKKVKAMFLWNITKDGKPAAQWTVDLKSGSGAVYRGPPKQGKPGCTLTLADDVFMKLASGKINGQQAFMQGKLKITGNIMLSQKLSTLFQDQSKL